MKELSLRVDREVEKVYIKLLRKELEHPENWGVYNEYYNEYHSPNINDQGVFFVTKKGKTNSFCVYQTTNTRTHKIHEIDISFWDFKTPRMLGVLFGFMPYKKKWLECQNTTKTLKSLLGIEFDRYAKIMKIKKKL